jgi:hypothetical protein
MMDLADAERWKSLERRARQRGWTIDFLAAAAATPSGKPGAFALVELNGDERPLATGTLDTIEAVLESA